MLVVPRIHTELARCAFSVAAPFTWNSLPADIQLCENILTFKRHLKTHLFKLTESSCAASSASVSAYLKPIYKSVIMIMIMTRSCIIFNLHKWYNQCFKDFTINIIMAFFLYVLSTYQRMQWTVHSMKCVVRNDKTIVSPYVNEEWDLQPNIGLVEIDLPEEWTSNRYKLLRISEYQQLNIQVSHLLLENHRSLI